MKRSLSWRRMRRNQHDIDTARRARSLILAVEVAVKQRRYHEAAVAASDLYMVLARQEWRQREGL
jgi:hypothetical protein